MAGDPAQLTGDLLPPGALGSRYRKKLQGWPPAFLHGPLPGHRGGAGHARPHLPLHRQAPPGPDRRHLPGDQAPDGEPAVAAGPLPGPARLSHPQRVGGGAGHAATPPSPGRPTAGAWRRPWPWPSKQELRRLIPQLDQRLVFQERISPFHLQKITLNSRGAAFGYQPSPDQHLFNRPDIRTPLRNLYLASAWSRYGLGVEGAVTNGMLVARDILGHAGPRGEARRGSRAGRGPLRGRYPTWRWMISSRSPRT